MFTGLTYFESLSFKQQVTAIHDSSAIIARHGAGLTNIIFSNYNTAVLELFPYNYYVPGFYGALALQSGLVYAAWYDSDPTHADATCMKKEWINGGPDICHETGSCRACARNVNLTINTEKQLHEVRFTFAQNGPTFAPKARWSAFIQTRSAYSD